MAKGVPVILPVALSKVNPVGNAGEIEYVVTVPPVFRTDRDDTLISLEYVNTTLNFCEYSLVGS